MGEFHSKLAKGRGRGKRFGCEMTSLEMWMDLGGSNTSKDIRIGESGQSGQSTILQDILPQNGDSTHPHRGSARPNPTKPTQPDEDGHGTGSTEPKRVGTNDWSSSTKRLRRPRVGAPGRFGGPQARETGDQTLILEPGLMCRSCMDATNILSQPNAQQPKKTSGASKGMRFPL